jgi:hypothetical protein
MFISRWLGLKFQKYPLPGILWLANLKGPSDVIRGILMAHVDNDDELVIIELPPGIDWATLRARPLGVAFLQALGPRQAA